MENSLDMSLYDLIKNNKPFHGRGRGGGGSGGFRRGGFQGGDCFGGGRGGPTRRGGGLPVRSTPYTIAKDSGLILAKMENSLDMSLYDLIKNNKPFHGRGRRGGGSGGFRRSGFQGGGCFGGGRGGPTRRGGGLPVRSVPYTIAKAS